MLLDDYLKGKTMKSHLMLCAVLLSLVSTVLAAETPPPEIIRNAKNPFDLRSNSPTALYPIEVQMYFIEYNMDDIEKLAREDKLEAEPLLAIWKKGGAKLLYAPRVLGQSGWESTVKGTTEYIYPTDVDVKVANTESSVTNSIPIVTPQNFIMREVGIIMQITPEITTGKNMFNITLAPSIVSQPTWNTHGATLMEPTNVATVVALEQPFFNVQGFASCINVSDGATVVVGGGMNNAAGDKTVFAFLRARLVDAMGKPLASRK